MATASPSKVGPFELAKAHAGLTDHTMERMREAQALIDVGESECNIARFIAGHEDFTRAERMRRGLCCTVTALFAARNAGLAPDLRDVNGESP